MRKSDWQLPMIPLIIILLTYCSRFPFRINLQLNPLPMPSESRFIPYFSQKND
jgi:hypothetical protein